MRPIVTDRAWSVGLSVGVSVTAVSPAKNGCTDRDAVWVEDSGGPGYHALDGCPDPPMGWDIFGGKGRPIITYGDTLRSSVQKRLNLTRCHLGCGLGPTVGVMC